MVSLAKVTYMHLVLLWDPAGLASVLICHSSATYVTPTSRATYAIYTVKCEYYVALTLYTHTDIYNIYIYMYIYIYISIYISV